MSTKKNNNKMKRKCSPCTELEETPIWGHPLCAYHRQCSGRDEWEPTKCTYCKKQKALLAKMSEEERETSIQSMLKMLDLTTAHKDDVIGVEWTYLEVAQNWLPKYNIQNKTVNPDENIDNSDVEQDSDINQKGREAQRNERQQNEDSDNDSSDHSDEEHSKCHYRSRRSRSRRHSRSPAPMRRVGEKQNRNEKSCRQAAHKHNSDRYESVYEDEEYDRNRYSRYRSDRDRYDNYETDEYENDNIRNRYNRERNGKRQRSASRPRHVRERRHNYDRRHRSPSPTQQDERHFDQDQYEEDYDEYNIDRNKEDYDYYDDSPRAYRHPAMPYDVDRTTGVTWINFDHRIHIRKDNNKIEILGATGPFTVNVRYKVGNSMQFQTVCSTRNDNRSPYIDVREGHAVILSAFDRSLSNNDFGNSKYIGIESSLAEGSGLAATFDLLKRQESTITETALEKGVGELRDTLPKTAFDAVSIIDFTSGWNLSNTCSFAAFAKDKEIDIKAFAHRIDGVAKHIDKRVNKFLLKRERDARRAMIQLITPQHLIELLGEKLDKLDEPTRNKEKLSSTLANAIGRTMLPVAGYLMCQWMAAKMAVRNAVLKKRHHPTTMKLLKSSMWEAGLCSEEAIREAETHPTSNLAAILGLSSYEPYKRDHFRPPPYKRMRGMPRRPPQEQNYSQAPSQRFQNPASGKPGAQRSSQRGYQQSRQTHTEAKENESRDTQKHQPQGRNFDYNKSRTRGNNRRGNQRR